MRSGRLVEHLRRIPNRRDIQSPGCLHREDGGRIEVTQNIGVAENTPGSTLAVYAPAEPNSRFCR